MTSSVTPSASAAPQRRLNNILRFDLGRLLSILVFATLIGSWHVSVALGWVPAFILPGPVDVGLRVIEDVLNPQVQYDTMITMTEILSGFALALAVGVPLGALIALVPMVDRVLTPYIIALQTIPKVAIAPLLIIWFGFGMESKIVIVALIDFFPILVNAVSGFRAVDPRQLLLMKVLKANPWQTFIKIRLPNAMPYLMAGVQIAMVFSIIGAVIGEFLGSARGLGSQIMQRQSSMDVVGVFSVLVILTLIGMALDAWTKIIARRAAFWTPASQTSV